MTAAIIIANNDDDNRIFPCTVLDCDKAYRRNEHLIRHLRSHRLQKPFICPKCRRSYGRQDVLKRHIAQQHPLVARPRDYGRHQRRALSACDRCHARKARCTGKSPCQPCLESNNTCQYSRVACSSKDRTESNTPSATTTDPSIESDSPRLASQTPLPGLSPRSVQLDYDAFSDANSLSSGTEHDGHLSTAMPYSPLNGPEKMPLITPYVPNDKLRNLHDCEPSNIDDEEPAQTDQTLTSVGADTQRSDIDPWLPIWSPDSYSIIQITANSNDPYSGASTTSDVSRNTETTMISTDDTTVYTGDLFGFADSSTFPNCDIFNIQADMQSQGISLDPPLRRHTNAAQDSWVHAPSALSTSAHPMSGANTDDAALHPVYGPASTVAPISCQNEHPDVDTSVATVPAFPPDSQTRQQCINTYFSRFHRLWPTVHRSTFTTESKNQDLVDSVIMIGAWLSGIGTWMETALRLHKSIMDRLAAKLAYLAFRLDICFYFLRGFRPTLRYDELYLTLPCSESLWEAQTLEEWHRVKRIESKKRSAIYFVNLVDQAMDQEGRAKLPPLLEDEYLYGLCAMQAWLWEDVHRHRSRTETRHAIPAAGNFYPAYFSRSIDYWATQLATWRECYRDRALGCTLSSKSHRETCDISAVPLFHLSQIVLRANLQAIKQLSSEHGHRSYSGTFMRQLEASTLGWVKTSDARLAMWHAAKVLKLVQEKTGGEADGSDDAHAAPRLELIASIALYEAGLVVWAYTRSVQVCDACVIGSSLQVASSDPDPFELFGTEQDQPFLEWLEHGGRESLEGTIVCACRLRSVVGAYEAALLRCGSQWRCVLQMANSLSRLKQGG
ncbi:unnamed protein product [Clonostachys solani]|uniref:Uncharacterized protein n=1 Tax=Clonostachys solani TaxID=160281 RepID=A0A9P0EFB5_9HYPO|nr:unnamed protein product [Clonostachys solani]